MRSARAQVSLVDRPQGTCSACRQDPTALGGMDTPSRFVDFRMALPAVDAGYLFVAGDRFEPLMVCERCLKTAARVVGLIRDPGDDPEVQSLRVALEGVLAELESVRADEADARTRLRMVESS